MWISRVTALGLVLGGSVVLVGAADREALPYRLQVRVGYGQEGGPETLRDDLERLLIVEVTARGCFRSVRHELEGAAQAGDLELSVTIQKLREEVQSDLSIASRSSPGAGPNAPRRMVARIAAVFQAVVRTRAESIPVREKRFHLSNSWRPVLEEDPREQVRREIVEDATKTIRSLLCKGSPKKWAQQIEQARAAAR